MTDAAGSCGMASAAAAGIKSAVIVDSRGRRSTGELGSGRERRPVTLNRQVLDWSGASRSNDDAAGCKILASAAAAGIMSSVVVVSWIRMSTGGVGSGRNRRPVALVRHTADSVCPAVEKACSARSGGEDTAAVNRTACRNPRPWSPDERPLGMGSDMSYI